MIEEVQYLQSADNFRKDWARGSQDHADTLSNFTDFQVNGLSGDRSRAATADSQQTDDDQRFHSADGGDGPHHRGLGLRASNTGDGLLGGGSGSAAGEGKGVTIVEPASYTGPRTGSVMRSEYERFNAVSLGWRLAELNHDYSFSPTYPDLLGVPATVDDELLHGAAKERSKKRIPTLTWVHPNGTPLCRSAQPMAGSSLIGTGKNTDHDIALLKEIRLLGSNGGGAGAPSQILRIVDARPKLNAQANGIMGKGFEQVKKIAGLAQIHFMDVGNIHVMRESIRSLAEACASPSENFQEEVAATKWLLHLRLVIRGASFIAHCLHVGEPVLVHCSDGWDRTAQLSSLSQLLLDPFYRTVEGFATLVEKDWCSFGHMMDKRCGSIDKHSTHETSPVFLQWLDCVYQIMTQFPTAFEFTDQFLLIIIDALYSRWFTTFLGDTEAERKVRWILCRRHDRPQLP